MLSSCTISLGVKRPGREADHSPPSIAEVKNARRYTSAPQYALMVWCYVKKKHRDKFTFTLLGKIGTGIAQRYSAGLRAGWSGFRVPPGAENFSLHHRVQTGSGAHPASSTQWIPGALSLGVKRPGLGADHSPPSSTGVKNAWNYTSPPIRLHGIVLS
jgi:hypothetical protein